MALASLDDINLHLPDDKISVDEARYDALQLDAERIVRGFLSGHTDLSTWVSPETTPGLVRSITGRLVAAFYYRDRYSEDSLTDPQFAQYKYDEAMSLLEGIVAGTIVLEEVTTPIGSNSLGAGDFYPNALAPGPYFTLDSPL